MERIGDGSGIAALLNGRAKRVSPSVVRDLQRALPKAQILVSHDFNQARRHARRIIADRPRLVLSGGGDGAVTRLLNLLREEGAEHLPNIGIMRLGTGNAWARAAGAPPYRELLRLLPKLQKELPTNEHDLVEVENTLCHFAGVGWDARLLNDYLRNLDKRSAQLLGSSLATRIHKGLGGYLYSLFRYTVPEEFGALLRDGQPRVTVLNTGDAAATLSSQGELVTIADSEAGAPNSELYSGPMSVCGAATSPEWGFGFKAFPFARIKPGFINLRVYNRPVLEATGEMYNLWRGRFPQPGMFDFFVKSVKLKFSRPMPFQIGGDGLGERSSIEMRAADCTVSVVDWERAIALAGLGPRLLPF